MRQLIIIFIAGALIAVGIGVSERQFIKRCLTFAGDPMVVPMQWYDPTETVRGAQRDDLAIAPAVVCALSASLCFLFIQKPPQLSGSPVVADA